LAATPWERFVVDPCPGPLHPEEIQGVASTGLGYAEVRGGCYAIRGCNKRVFTPQVCRVASISKMPVYIVDLWRGARGVAEALSEIAGLHGVEALLAVDVGGDVLAEGFEPSLWSPLADAIGLAASVESGLPAVAVVHSPGADGELPIDYILERLGDVAAAGGLRAARLVSRREIEAMEELVASGFVTEAGLAQVLAARGVRGLFALRGGTRRVELSILQAMVHRLPPEAEFTSFGLGAMQMPMVVQSVMLGGHVRVGLEDNLYLERGVFATNAQLVEKAVRILELTGVSVQSPAEARQTLGLG
jgi:hypothetical protein